MKDRNFVSKVITEDEGWVCGVTQKWSSNPIGRMCHCTSKKGNAGQVKIWQHIHCLPWQWGNSDKELVSQGKLWISSSAFRCWGIQGRRMSEEMPRQVMYSGLASPFWHFASPHSYVYPEFFKQTQHVSWPPTPCFPSLALCNFLLIQEMKIQLLGWRFKDVMQIEVELQADWTASWNATSRGPFSSGRGIEYSVYAPKGSDLKWKIPACN